MQAAKSINNLANDIIFRAANDIILDQVNILKDIFKMNFSRTLAINLYPQNIQWINYVQTDRVTDEQDLIIANLFLHHENDIIAKIASYKARLAKGGAVLITLLGGRTLTELRQILEQTELELSGGVSPRVIPMINLKDATSIMQAINFKQVITHSEVIRVEYDAFYQMLTHAKNIGQSNCLSRRNKKYVGRNFFGTAEQKALGYFNGKKFSNTFEIICMTGIV